MFFLVLMLLVTRIFSCIYWVKQSGLDILEYIFNYDNLVAWSLSSPNTKDIFRCHYFLFGSRNLIFTERKQNSLCF